MWEGYALVHGAWAGNGGGTFRTRVWQADGLVSAGTMPTASTRSRVQGACPFLPSGTREGDSITHRAPNPTVPAVRTRFSPLPARGVDGRWDRLQRTGAGSRHLAASVIPLPTGTRFRLFLNKQKDAAHSLCDYRRRELRVWRTDGWRRTRWQCGKCSGRRRCGPRARCSAGWAGGPHREGVRRQIGTGTGTPWVGGSRVDGGRVDCGECRGEHGQCMPPGGIACV